MARLGDYPGLDDMTTDGRILSILPVSSGVTEVNAFGEVVSPDSDDDPLGAVGANGTDPFALRAGFLDREKQQEGKGHNADGSAATGPSANYASSSFLPTVDSTGAYVGPDAPLPTVSNFDQEQLANAKVIADTGKSLGASDRDIQIALMAAIVESGLRNLDYGDRDSIGMFQQRDAWGSREDRLDPAKSAAMFFKGGAAGQQGLLQVTDRDSRPMGEVAQDVQVSAFPERYAEHEQEAASIMGALSGAGKPTEGSVTRGSYKGKNPYDLVERDGETVDNLTSAALDAAIEQFGAPMRIMQGSHSTDVDASGNTHAGGGVVDIAVENGDWVNAMNALRKTGFAAWVRNVPGFGQAGSGAHIHAVLIGDKELSPEAEVQVQSYFNNDNALAGSAPDDGPRDWVNNRFEWGDALKADAEASRGGRRLKDGEDDGNPLWRNRVVQQAQRFVGTPFKWGGEDHEGVDDEGFLRSVYGKLGVDIPAMADDITKLADPVPVSEIKPGDLISWDDDKNEMTSPSLGVYVGGGQFIEAGGPGRVVQLNDVGMATLNAVGIPMKQVINSVRPNASQLKPVTFPRPTYNPGTVETTETSKGTSVVEPHASIPAGPSVTPKKPKDEGAFSGGTTFDQKPKGLPA